MRRGRWTPSVKRSNYLDLRRRFEPDNVTLVIVAESPPASGRYFYDTTGSIKEPLFTALMKQLGVAPASKEAGLRDFQRRGWIFRCCRRWRRPGFDLPSDVVAAARSDASNI